MSHFNNISENINKLNVSESTKRTYINRLNSVVNYLSSINSDVLLKNKSNKKIFKITKVPEIINILRNKSDKINALYNDSYVVFRYLILFYDENSNKKIIKFKQQMDEIKDKLRNDKLDVTLNKNESNVDFNKGVKLFRDHIRSKGNKNLTSPELQLALFLFFGAVRRTDILDSYIGDYKDVNKTDNWLFFDEDKKWKYLANKHKTVKKYGPQLFILKDKDLIKILRLLYNNTSFKLFNVTKLTLSKQLKKITKEFFGEPLTAVSLRRLDASNDNLNDKKKLLEKASRAGHSINTRIIQYRRNKQ